MLSARIFLTISRHPSLSPIALCRYSGLYPVSAQSCCVYVRAGRLAFAHPCEGVHMSTLFMSSSILLQKCRACMVRLILIIFVMGGRCPYSCCFVVCCHQDCSTLLATFLYNCRRTFSLSVSLASMWFIHMAVSTRSQLGKNCASFYSSGPTSISPKVYR